MRPTQLQDQEFGIIPIKRIARAKYVRVRVMANGSLQATMPKLAPVFLLKNLVEKSRVTLREALAERGANATHVYADGEQIGTSHTIALQYGETAKATRRGQRIIWTIPLDTESDDETNQETVRKAVRKALNEQAMAYLPRRLQYLAELGGFTYSQVRYGNAKGRWGSCSSQGVISLNVALMRLPKELIDYVLIHELSHTKHLNHSANFWSLVETYYPDYKTARKELKSFSPYL